MCRSGSESGGTSRRRCSVTEHTKQRYNTARLLHRYAKRVAAAPSGDQGRDKHWNLFMGQYWRWQELTGQAPQPPKVEGFTSARDYSPGACSWMSDELLDEALREEAHDPLAQMAICSELDRRSDARAQKEALDAQLMREQQQQFEEWARRNEEAAAARGAEMERCRQEWLAEAPERNDPLLNPSLRRTHTRSDEMAQAREDFELYLETAYLQAEEDCRGTLLNARGYAKRISPRSLFSGHPNRVEAYASDELKGWFNIHGRMTFAAWRYQAMGYESDREAANRSRFETYDAADIH